MLTKQVAEEMPSIADTPSSLSVIVTMSAVNCSQIDGIH